MILPAIALPLVFPLALPLAMALDAAGATGGLPAVSVVIAPGVDCPGAAAIEGALGGMRGGNGAPPSRPSDPGDAWTLFVERAGADVQISLRDPAGVGVLSRVLAAPGAHCESTAQAIAIVVERYFRDLAWTPDGRARTDQPRPPSVSAAAQPTVVAMADDELPRPRFEEPVLLALGAGPVLWTRMGGPAAVLDARFRIAGHVVVRAATLLPPFRSNQTLPTEAGQPQAVARTWGMPLLAGIGVSGTRGRFGGTFGLETLLTFEQGESQGIAESASEQRTVLAAGVGLGGSVAFGRQFRFSADVAGYRAALGRSFEVGGLANPVLEPPKWQAVFGLRLEWVVLP